MLNFSESHVEQLCIILVTTELVSLKHCNVFVSVLFYFVKHRPPLVFNPCIYNTIDIDNGIGLVGTYREAVKY